MGVIVLFVHTCTKSTITPLSRYHSHHRYRPGGTDITFLKEHMMNQVTLYTSDACAFCQEAKNLLKLKNVNRSKSRSDATLD